jgi:hypothetical protein
MAHHSQHVEHHEKTTDEQIVWEIKSHDHRERSNKFYIIILSATVLLLFFSIWQKDFLFGIFVILASGTILFLSAQKPENYKFKLSKDAIIIGESESVYSYEKFSHFDVYEFNPEEQELFFAFKEKFRPILRIRIYKDDLEKIKDFLSGKLIQKKIEPSILDIFSKIVGI